MPIGLSFTPKPADLCPEDLFRRHARPGYQPGGVLVSFDPANPSQVVSQREIGRNDDASATDLGSLVNFSVPGDGIYFRPG